MVHKVLYVNFKEGLRAKNASIFVETASRFSAQIIVEKDNKKVNAKSIMGVLSLGLDYGASMHVRADGEDENQAILSLENILNQE